MNVGQYISLKSNADYADVYDAPAITSHAEGVTAGYIGKISQLNVQGIGDSRFFIEVINKDNEKKYLDTVDKDLFEVSDTNPMESTNTGGTIGGGTTGGNSGGTSGGSGSSTSTLDKILGIFTGISTIFGKTKTTTSPTGTGTGSSSGRGSSSSGSSGEEDPTPSNNTPSFGEWFAKNWIWAVPAIIIVPGGIILLIVTLVKASKKKNEIAVQNRIPYDGNKI